MTDLIQFDAGSGQRIADVVRIVESQFPHARPLNFDRVFSDAKKAKVFRICTFTGAWAIGSTKTVTVGTTPATSTVQATNLFFPLTSGGSRTGAVARDGTAWYLIDVPLTTAVITQVTTATASVVQSMSSQSVLADVAFTAVLNTSNCVINVSSVKSFSTVMTVTGTATATVIASTSTAVVVRFA